MYRHRSRRRQRGQIVPITALAMIALIGGVALILEGGNAYAHQREAQNASDAVANAGATVLAQQLGGTAKTARPRSKIATNSRMKMGRTSANSTRAWPRRRVTRRRPRRLMGCSP